MKSFPILVLSMAMFLLACNEGGTNATAGSSLGTEPPSGQFYKRFEGTVAGQPVVVHWHQSDNYVYAVYSYPKQGRRIQLYNWEDTTQSDASFYLTERSVTELAEDTDPHWVVSLSGNKISGKWYSRDNKKSHPIELTERYASGSYQFSLAYFSDSASLLSTKSEPKAISTHLLISPASSIPEAKQQFLSSVIRRMLGCDPSVTDAKRCIDKKNQQYFETYKTDVLDMDTTGVSGGTADMPFLNYSAEQDILVVHNENDLVVLENFSRDYSGGAHGNYGSSFENIDMKEQRVLGLDEIINASDTLKVKAALQSSAASYFRAEPGQSLKEYIFEEQVPLTDNFYLTNSGITFVYTPYEIAAYAAGQIEIFMPYSSVKDFLTPSFRLRMNL